MEPLRNITWGLQFAAQKSPLWLILLIPVVAALAWYLYRRQSENVAPANAIGLALLRCLLVVVLAFLAFRPSLVRTEVLRFPGRLLTLFDDSESMGVPDPRLPVPEALRIARMDEGVDDESAQAPYKLADSATRISAQLEQFRRFSKDVDRSLDTFWNRADAFENDVRTRYEALSEALPEIGAANAMVAEDAAEAGELLKGLRAQLSTLTTGNRHPGSEAFDAYASQVQNLRQALLQIQEAIDEHALRTDAPGAERLRSRIEQVHRTRRTELVARTMRQIDHAADTQLTDQFLQYQSLVDGERILDMPQVTTAPGGSDILRELQAIVDEDTEFPLSGVLLLTDGRDTEGGELEGIARVASRNKIPVYSLPVGASQEPPDLAVLGVLAPPVAILGRQVDVRVLLKTATPPEAPDAAAVRLLDAAGAVMAETTVPLGGDGSSRVVFSLTPEEAGVKRFRVELETVDGEVIAARNNRAQFALRVRPEPVNVLFLDTKPRWESRFALNLLRRLDYVQLNPIVVLTSKEQALVRGAQSGQWPADLSVLQMYDLVVLGNVREETLTEDDWKALKSFVEDKGGTICFLNGMGGAPMRAAARRWGLYPLAEAAAVEISNEDRLSAQFRLTSAGRYHPFSRGLSRALPAGGTCMPDQLTPRSVALMTAEAGQHPVAACRFVGSGRTMALDTSLLWKRLNTHYLDVHENLYLNLVTWAADVGAVQSAEGDAADAEGRQGPTVWPGERVLEQGATKQVLAGSDLQGDTVSLVGDGGDKPVEADLVELPCANGVCGAQFERLAPETYRMQLNGTDVLPDFSMAVTAREKELRVLARNDELLERISAGTGGTVVPLYDAATILSRLPPKVRIEEHRRVYRLWDAMPILLILIVALAIEWIWRKLAGLI